MPRHTEKAHETLGLTGETQIVALADFHGRFDNHHQPWWVWALTGQARLRRQRATKDAEILELMFRQCDFNLGAQTQRTQVLGRVHGSE